MPSTRECGLLSYSVHTHTYKGYHTPSALFSWSISYRSIPIRYPTHGELYTICASSYYIRRDLSCLLSHRHRGFFHPSFPVPPSRTARRYVRRRRKMALRPRSRGKTRQMRDIFLWSVSSPSFRYLRSGLTSNLFMSQVSTASPRSNRHC